MGEDLSDLSVKRRLLSILAKVDTVWECDDRFDNLKILKCVTQQR